MGIILLLTMQVFVCGRMNEILCGDFRTPHVYISTGGGENVAPVPIEEDIKAELGEVVSQAMLVGIEGLFTKFFLSLKSHILNSDQQLLYHTPSLSKI